MEILLLGNYCHDTLVRPNGNLEVLGGSSSYISKALEAARIDYELIAKVGEDFLYHSEIVKKPLISSKKRTTHFLDTITQGNRTSVLGAVGEEIFPDDLPAGKFKIGLACGVMNEIRTETLLKLRAQVDFLICDVQGLIRRVDENRNMVHVHLKDTPFFELLPLIDVLKANLFESTFIDFNTLGKTSLVITEGPAGSRLIEKGVTTRIQAPATQEVDT